MIRMRRMAWTGIWLLSSGLALSGTGCAGAGHGASPHNPVAPQYASEDAGSPDATPAQLGAAAEEAPSEDRDRPSGKMVMAPPSPESLQVAPSKPGPRKRHFRQAMPGPAAERPHNTEGYELLAETGFRSPRRDPLSTFSIDVDTASYSNMRRFLTQGKLPPVDAVRIEELLNYFSYDYPAPAAGAPFSVTTEISEAPWAPQHRLVHVGLKGRDLSDKVMPPRNLVFLLDVSGSMSSANKLPLLQASLKQLVNGLNASDRVAIVVYAGASGLVLPSTAASNKQAISEALDRLQAGGSTNGGAGIELAYAIAQKHFNPRGINRVILATDGDFNVGTTNRGDLTRLIEKKRASGVYLTVLGFGMGNYKDNTLEVLADKGNGNYAYIDNIQEARKVLVKEAGATLVTIAKDVKIQVEFNPSEVAAYRLIGYQNRRLRNEDFNNDRKDAGEIGAGHTVTALYEVVPVGVAPPVTGSVDALKYQKPSSSSPGAGSSELLTLKLRYKTPTGSRSRLISMPVRDGRLALAQTSDAYRFSAAVAGFGMMLRRSKHRGSANWGMLNRLAQGAVGRDRHGYRRQMISLLGTAQRLSGPAIARSR